MALLIVFAAVALACVALIGTGRPTSRPAARPAPPTPSSTPSSQSPPVTASAGSASPPATTAPPFREPVPVGETDVTVTRDGRRFPVVVLYPATRAGSDAPPRPARRAYPLVVFSPGFDIDPVVYTPLVAAWAGAGYVVAEPYYPFTAQGAPGGVNESDIVQHPADLRSVIDAMVRLSSAPTGVLAGMVDPARIGLAGHSDGGDVTDAVIADSCCRDARVKAAEVLSGAELAGFGGSYGPPGVPLLAVQGDADQINAPACSEQIYDGSGMPRYYLDLRGAGHLPPYTATPGSEVYQQAVSRVTLLFWEAYLGGDSSALSALRSPGAAGAAGTLTAGGSVAKVGTCPGAP